MLPIAGPGSNTDSLMFVAAGGAVVEEVVPPTPKISLAELNNDPTSLAVPVGLATAIASAVAPAISSSPLLLLRVGPVPVVVCTLYGFCCLAPGSTAGDTAFPVVPAATATLLLAAFTAICALLTAVLLVVTVFCAAVNAAVCAAVAVPPLAFIVAIACWAVANDATALLYAR